MFSGMDNYVKTAPLIFSEDPQPTPVPMSKPISVVQETKDAPPPPSPSPNPATPSNTFLPAKFKFSRKFFFVVLGILLLFVVAILLWNRYKKGPSKGQKNQQSRSVDEDAKNQSTAEGGSPSQEEAAACSVPENCQGIACAAKDEKCLNNPAFNGLKGNKTTVQVRLPDQRIIFSYPLTHRRLLLPSGRCLAVDDNGLRIVQPTGHNCEYWSFNGRVLSNDDNNMLLVRGINKDVLAEQRASLKPDPDALWLFDGQRFYSQQAIDHGKFDFLTFDPLSDSLVLKQGLGSDVYRQMKTLLTVEDYTPDYSFH